MANPREKASEQYFNSPEEGDIYPVSSIDVQIIEQLIKIIELVDSHGALTPIVRKYKCKSDSETLKDLEKLNSKLFDWEGPPQSSSGSSGYAENSDDDKYKKHFIHFENHIISVKDLKHITTLEEYDFGKGRNQYIILINSAEAASPFQGVNIRIVYLNPKVRDERLEELKMRLDGVGNVMFI